MQVIRYGVPNGGFESAPAFTAATTTNARWVNGTAAGSTTNDQWGWAKSDTQGTSAVQFDNSTSHSGSGSLKLSTQAVASRIEVTVATNSTAASLNRYGVRVSPSIKYTGSYWMSTNFVSGDSADGAYLVFSEVNATGGGIASNLPSKVKTTTGWTQYSVSFTTNASTSFVQPRMRVYGQTGTATLIMDAWFDDIFLIPVARSLI